jgi:predicted Rossmann fold nucleotide-binding protein DprA/Smf involved in DNA uptake
MPFSTPHGVAIVLYSPVCIGCSTASRSVRCRSYCPPVRPRSRPCNRSRKARPRRNLDNHGRWSVLPKRLHSRLGDTAPVALHGVGDTALLDTDGVGVVGSRDISAKGSQVAREIAERAVKSGLPVISGAARGVDNDAMNAAFEAGGQVVGVPADALERAVARRGTRQGVAKGRICLITPYTPAATFSTGNAMGRNKIIYGLSRCTVVVTSDHQTGGTWAGATEALKHSYGRVASWTGPGSGPGNNALVEQGVPLNCRT